MRQGQALFSSRQARNESAAWAALFPFAHTPKENFHYSGNDWLQVLAAVIGALLAGLISYLISKNERNNNQKHANITRIIALKSEMLSLLRIINRNWVKSAEAEMLAKVDQMAARYMRKIPPPDDVDLKSTTTDATYYVTQMNYHQGKIDEYNTAAEDALALYYKAKSELISISGIKTEHNPEFISLPVQLPAEFNSVEDHENALELVNLQRVSLREKYLCQQKEIEEELSHTKLF